jgi:hypothetical protein
MAWLDLFEPADADSGGGRMGIVNAIAAAQPSAEARQCVQKPHKDLRVAKGTAIQAVYVSPAAFLAAWLLFHSVALCAATPRGPFRRVTLPPRRTSGNHFSSGSSAG